MIRFRNLFTVISLVTVVAITVGTSLVWGMGSAGSIVTSGSSNPEQSSPGSFWGSYQGLIWMSPAAAIPPATKPASRGVMTDSPANASGREVTAIKNRAGARYLISSTNIIVRFGGNQACHYLDIPPPFTPSFL